MRDKDRANKNEIEIFVFSVTSNDFPHDVLLLIFSSKLGPSYRIVGSRSLIEGLRCRIVAVLVNARASR